ncbi:unnamed protein product [Cylicocyclus nassatus]|uniref:Uncharacterized protein n=1 Tax=Cylicocyclus nassatus TaxID=53992 RepID=A0AA36H9J8_CYLNA|nr:unnamed protein product [Cylicocyclus nassatus]
MFFRPSSSYAHNGSARKDKRLLRSTNSRNGRNDKLKSLSEVVEDILQDMGEDMLGYRQDELKVCLIKISVTPLSTRTLERTKRKVERTWRI